MVSIFSIFLYYISFPLLQGNDKSIVHNQFILHYRMFYLYSESHYIQFYLFQLGSLLPITTQPPPTTTPQSVKPPFEASNLVNSKPISVEASVSI